MDEIDLFIELIVVFPNLLQTMFWQISFYPMFEIRDEGERLGASHESSKRNVENTGREYERG